MYHRQADSEFDLCIARRDEALTVMDEGPSYGIFPIVYYYQGRVREELKTANFADSYREYLRIRGESTEDPLVPEVRKRLDNRQWRSTLSSFHGNRHGCGRRVRGSAQRSCLGAKAKWQNAHTQS
jgi:hypothetical protein